MKSKPFHNLILMHKKIMFYYIVPVVTAIFLIACNAVNDAGVPRLSDRTPSGIVSFMGSVIESGHIISGQHCGDGDNIDLVYEREVERLFDLTGSRPALIGADYGWKPDNDFDVINRRLIDHWNEGGLVTISWHADNPFSDSDRYNPRINTVAGKGSIDLSMLLSTAPENEAGRRYFDELDIVIKNLEYLRDNGVVVIWRPFHEMNGNWFWWGTDSFGDGQTNVDAYVSLWRDMYDIFVNRHGLTNLVWVFSPTTVESYTAGADTYYPGGDYVDVVGLSSYKPVPELKDYAVLSKFGKPFVMSEIGPDRETYGKFDQMLLVEYLSGKAAYFLQWHSWTGAKVSIVDNLNFDRLMEDPRVITLEDL
ncbi:MAG: hypothetical protein EA408_12660 [Marinilabiliales bacterium]|nr:MAG: hypothetical protein EA408_12660 [Marinilabiliales bacterium]